MRITAYIPEKKKRVLELCGRLDHQYGIMIAECGFNKLENLNQLHINMANITYINSMGIGAIVRLKMKCDELGVRLTFSDIPNLAIELLDILQLSPLLRIYKTQQEALEE